MILKLVLLLTTCQAALTYGEEIPSIICSNHPTVVPTIKNIINSPAEGASFSFPSGDSLMLSTNDNGKYGPSCPCNCLKEQIETHVRPVVYEYISKVPVIKKTVKLQEEKVTHHVPIIENTITHQEQNIIKHVPIIKKITRPVVESRTHHVPVTTTRIKTVTEPYITHVPIIQTSIRPVEETIIRHEPIIETHITPVVTQHIKHVPVTIKRSEPILESQIINVPIKRHVLKSLMKRISSPVESNDELPDIAYTSGETMVADPSISCLDIIPLSYNLLSSYGCYS